MDGMLPPRLRRFDIEPRLYADFGVGEGIAAAGIAVSVATAAASAAQAMQQAKQQQQAAAYNAQVQNNNAQVASWQRQQQEQEAASASLAARTSGAQETSQLDLRNNELVAKNIAAAASSGVTTTGSTSDAILGSAYNNDLESLQSQYKTNLDGWQAEIGATNASYNSLTQQKSYSAQASLDTSEGNNAIKTGMFSVAGDVVSGAGKANEAAAQVNYFD